MASRILENLPNELWNRMITIIVSCSLRDALSLCQTCSRLLSSYPGQRVRYLCALASNGLSIPSTLAEPKENLSHEADLLFNRWPFASPKSLFSLQNSNSSSPSLNAQPQFLGRPQLFGQTLIDLSSSREEILVSQISPIGSTEEFSITKIIKSPHPEWGPMRELSIDIDSGTLAVVYEWETHLQRKVEEDEQEKIEPIREKRGVISLQVLSLLSGKVISSPHHHVLDRDESAAISSLSSLQVSSSSPPSTFSSPLSVGRTFLSAELKGSRMLLAAQDQVQVFSWSLKRWKRIFNRKMSENEENSVQLDLLSASFFPSNQDSRLAQASNDQDPHCLVVMSSPASSLHGLDWGSSLQFFKLPQVSNKRQEEFYSLEPDFYSPSLENGGQDSKQRQQVPDVSISLPIKAKIKPAVGRGLNYIRTGDSKRERFGDNDDLGKRKDREVGDSLVVICVEGFIWLATLSSFLEILYPVSALAIFGEDPTLRLGVEWVRGNLTRCSLSAADTATATTPVSVSGWRLAVPWSRSPFAQQRGPRTQSGGPSAAFIRFLDASPRNRDKKKIKDVVGGENGIEKVHVSTMWWPENNRYVVYFDHFLDSYLPAADGASGDILLVLEGSRVLLSMPVDSLERTIQTSSISIVSI